MATTRGLSFILITCLLFILTVDVVIAPLPVAVAAAAAAFGGVSDAISVAGSAASLIAALYGEAIGIDLENHFTVGLSYETPSYEFDGEKIGIINPTIGSGTKDKAIGFDDGSLQWGGVAGAIRYSVQKLDGTKYCMDVVYSANAMFCRYGIGGKYFDGYAIKIGTLNCRTAIKISYEDAKKSICRVMQNDWLNIVHRGSPRPYTKTKKSNSGGWNWALRTYQEPMKFHSKDKLISVRSSMENKKNAVVLIEVGPFEYWRGRSERLSAPIMPAIDYKDNYYYNDEYYDYYPYYDYLISLEMDLLIFIVVGSLFVVCCGIIGLIAAVKYFSKKQNKQDEPTLNV